MINQHISTCIPKIKNSEVDNVCNAIINLLEIKYEKNFISRWLYFIGHNLALHLKKR